jgi:hypothetical protein
MELKPFTTFDWDCWSGAEKGPLGQPPAIGYIQLDQGDFPDAFDDTGIVIVDKSGITLETQLGESGRYFLSCTFAAGLAIGQALVEPLQTVQLDALGFGRIS